MPSPGVDENGREPAAELHDRSGSRTSKRVNGSATANEIEIEVARRRRAERALSAVQQQLDHERTLIADGPVVVFRWCDQPGWPLQYVSANVLNVLGYSAEEFLSGRIPHAELIESADYDRVVQELRSHAEAGRDSFRHKPYRLIKKSGEVIWVDNFTTILRDQQQQVTHFQGYILDITELRRTEQQLRESQRKLRLDNTRRRALETQLLQAQKLESLGLLASGVAHDFNNFLTTILGNTDLLATDLPPGSPLLSRIGEIIRAAENAADLADQMLTFAGSQEPQQARLQLNDLAGEMIQLLRVSIPKSIHLRVEARPEVPKVEGSASQLRQVLMNLIINSSEAIEDGEGTIWVRTGMMHAEPALLSEPYLEDDLPAGTYSFFEVEDTGAGMSEETRSKLFDPFYTTKPTGRGLGMATVLGIVRTHRGALKVASEPGKGSCFRVLLRSIDS